MANKQLDQYFTPPLEAENVFRSAAKWLNLDPSIHTIVDPFAGAGAFLNAAMQHGFRSRGYEIDKTISQLPNVKYVNYFTTLVTERFPEPHSVIVTNPPFGQMDLVLNSSMVAMSRCNVDAVVLLCRTTICESSGREHFWQRNPPNLVARCSSRINWVDEKGDRLEFINRKGDVSTSTDSIGCDVIIWDARNRVTYGETKYHLAWPNRDGVDFNLTPF